MQTTIKKVIIKFYLEVAQFIKAYHDSHKEKESIKKITLKSYLDFAQLIQVYQGTHEENRVFALKHKQELENPTQLVLLWMKTNLFHLGKATDSENFLHHFSSVSNLIGFLFLLMGFFAGIGLLSYSGHAPVNIIYYLLFAMIIPLLSMLITIFSMMSREEAPNFFNLFFSLYWIEKMVSLFALSDKIKMLNSSFPQTLKKWMFIHRLQLFSLLFSVGLLLSLLIMVLSKDIAFAWSTTLKVTPMAFHELLNLVAKPWEFFVPSAIPSVELVEMSQYFRLGETLNQEMLQHADKLGAWWKFLAMATLFYAIFLRAIFWLLSRYGYQKQLEKNFLDIEGMERLIHEFQTPYVSTEAPKVEQHLPIVEETDVQVKENERRVFNNIVGWNFSDDEITLANDSKEMKGISIDGVGGSHTFTEDQEVSKSVSRTVLLYVKSWEPPTMDFVDFLELLIESKKVDEIQVYPLGTVGRYYESDAKDIAVWKRKIQGLKSKKVWVIDE